MHLALDLLASDPQLNYLNELRTEAAKVFPTENFASSWSSFASMAQLSKLDSTIRETLRLNPTVLRQATRCVMPENGIVLPDGTSLPQGTWIGFLSRPGTHADARFYDEPDKYDPFRYNHKENHKERDDAISHKPEMATTISDTFLAWGKGRSAWYVKWSDTWFVCQTNRDVPAQVDF